MPKAHYKVEITGDSMKEGQGRRLFFGASCSLDTDALIRLVGLIEQGLSPPRLLVKCKEIRGV